MNKNWTYGHVDPWWDNSYLGLDYEYLPMKNTQDVKRWISQGYTQVTLNGGHYGFPKPMPKFVEKFKTLHEDWLDIGITLYKMQTMDMLPLHKDHFSAYAETFAIEDKSKIWRCIVFLEDWKSGHYFEMDSHPIVKWQSGDWVAWNNDVEHFAANIGTEPRFTVQITGHRS